MESGFRTLIFVGNSKVTHLGYAALLQSDAFKIIHLDSYSVIHYS